MPGTAYAVLFAISFCHLLNDMMQSLIPALYPVLKRSFGLDFGQIGLITLTFQLTASLLQPLVGLYTDRRPKPFSLVAGMGFTLVGLVLLSLASSYPILLLSAGLVGSGLVGLPPRVVPGGPDGLGRPARLRPVAVPGRRQRRIGPRPAARGVHRRAARAVEHRLVLVVALLGMVILTRVGRWYRAPPHVQVAGRDRAGCAHDLPRGRVVAALVILLVLVFSKYFYLASLSSYYTFYLIDKFGVSVQTAQLHLFVFLGAVAAGTIIGGPVGDRIGRKWVIWGSILGVLPFTLALPYANLFWTGVLSVRDRPDPRVRVLRDPGVRPGAGAGPGGHGLRPLLRVRVRHGRHRRRAAG